MTNPLTELRFGQDIMDRVGGVVLGGGRGQRLHPLTALRAKPAVPLLGRYRLVDIPLSQCIHSGVKRVAVLTQFNSASLHRHIQDSYHFDHFSRGFIEILAAEQTNESGDWYQGTADAVRQQLRHLRHLGADYYLILSGDQLYRMDYRALVKTHVDNGAHITVSALPVDAEAAAGFGILRVNKSGRIRDFVEKPSSKEELAALESPPTMLKSFGLQADGRPYLASMGLYVFNVDVLEELLNTRREWNDFGKDVIPGSMRHWKVQAHLFNGFWEDIGTVRSYYNVHMQMCSDTPPFDLFEPARIIYTHPRYLPGSRLTDARIKESIICEGSRIFKASIHNSIIGIRSIVREGASIDRTIMMGADYLETPATRRGTLPIGIGAHCVIRNAIIDKNACIGNNVVIRGSAKLRDCDGDGYAVRDGLVIVMKNAAIPNGTRIE